ncbi:hypothetical protein [Brevibacterium aurantiacum]|nr:hypothetical protein [Brevibacterium aurantiacum]MDN5608741.1 hypothetical protein [Brevibacterium sp.]
MTQPTTTRRTTSAGVGVWDMGERPRREADIDRPQNASAGLLVIIDGPY